jgi:hypothetical protein
MICQNKFYKLSEQNMCRYRTNYVNCRNKYVYVSKIRQTTRIKHLYVPNNLYELSKQICTIIWTIRTNLYTCRMNSKNNRTKHLYPKKLHELQEQICIYGETNSRNYRNKTIYTYKQIIWTHGTNMYTCGINSTNSWNKIFVHTKQIIWIYGKQPYPSLDLRYLNSKFGSGSLVKLSKNTRTKKKVNRI